MAKIFWGLVGLAVALILLVLVFRVLRGIGGPIGRFAGKAEALTGLNG